MTQQISKSDFLIDVIQKLSSTRSLDGVTQIVRQAARELVRADGATFVLREKDNCYYVDEDAVAPLWKGRRFPLETCISGWVMINKSQVIIPDIYVDERIPHDAYRPTFVKSLVMTPIRKNSPVGAVGTYWANHHTPSPADAQQLQILADATSIAIENVNLLLELETRVSERTRQLQTLNKELESFTDSISHDLKTPLINIGTLLEAMLEAGELPEECRLNLSAIHDETKRLSSMVTDLLSLAKIAHTDLIKRKVDLTPIVRETFGRLKSCHKHQIAIKIQDDMQVLADSKLIAVVIENLLSNACKYSSKTDNASIEVGLTHQDAGRIFFVRDNGAGFDMDKVGDLFVAFKRLHNESDFQGHGVGLASVQRIVKRHNGEIWAESAPGKGACFYVLLPDAE